MKGVIFDVKTGKARTIDDGQPFPQIPAERPEGVDFLELKKLVDFAKKQGWI